MTQSEQRSPLTTKKVRPRQVAIAYASAGYAVTPIWVMPDPDDPSHFTKVPPAKCAGILIDGEGGVAAATTDISTVERYWNTTYTNRRGKQVSTARCYVGVVPPVGVIVLDDDGHVFDEVWAERPHVRTPSGGRHYYFRLEPAQTGLVSTNGLLYNEDPPGTVDIRVGGDRRFYIVVPSGTRNRLYRKVNGFTARPDRLDVLPDDVYQRLLTAPRRRSEGSAALGAGKHKQGVPDAFVGLSYDERGDEAERLLSDAGWTTEDGERWVRPGGTNGEGMLRRRDDEVWFFNVHTTKDERLRGGSFYTPSMLRCVFDHDGDWDQCWSAMLADGSTIIGTIDEGEGL